MSGIRPGPIGLLGRGPWQRVYLFLALFSLAGASISFYLETRIIGTFSDSIAAGRGYSRQFSDLQLLGDLATSVGQIIKSQSDGSTPEIASEGVKPALALFEHRLQALQEDFAGSAPAAEKAQLRNRLTMIDRSIHQWLNVIQKTEAALRGRRSDVISKQILIENQGHAEVDDAFSRLREDLAISREDQFDAHSEALARLQRIGLIVSTFAVFVVSGAMIYGFKMARRVDNDAREKASYVADLHESRKLYQGLVEDAVVGVFRSTQGGAILGFNPAFAHTLGYDSPAELQAHTHGIASEIFVDPTRRLELVRTLQEHDKVSGFEFQAHRKDGSTIWISESVRLVRHAADNSVHIEGFIHDITERKLAEDAARRENAKLLAMIGGMEEGVVFADAADSIVEVNDYFCRFVKQPREQILGKHLGEFHAGRVWEVIRAQIDHYRRAPASKPLVIQRPLGKTEVMFRVQPIYRDGKYDGIVVNIIDVTELVQAQQHAEDASLAKGAFLANMSHEIRTPLTAILGYVDLLMDRSRSLSAAKRDTFLAVIRRNGGHLLELINDILDLSKMEAGKLEVETVPCDLTSIIADVSSMLHVRAEQQGITLTVEYSTDIPQTIQTDAVRLRQVLTNLVGNAVKFTKQGGVRIAIALLPDGHEGRPAVRIDVADTGIGISKEKLAQLFQPFFQADPSTSRRYGGTGLGLTIAQHIAHLLHGALTVESTLGKGSIFTITIPTGSLQGIPMVHCPGEAVQDSPAPVSSAPTNPRSIAGLRILLAEDGLDNQRLITVLLQRAGGSVEIADDGRKAVAMAQDGTFDVVLMDMQMPEMDGYQATRTLRQYGYHGPILALTAHAMSGDRERCMEAGCNDHLAKPIDRERLISAVARYAGRISTAFENRSESAPAVCLPIPQSLRSLYADDPDVAPILGTFVDGLSGQVSHMGLSARTGAYDELRRQAHQIKGAGGSYGYPALTDAAARLEDAAHMHEAETVALALDQIEILSSAIVQGAASEMAMRATHR